MTSDDALEILRIAATEATVEGAALRLKPFVFEWDVNARLAALAEGILSGSLHRRLYAIGVTNSMLREMGDVFSANGLEPQARAEISDLWWATPYKVDACLGLGITFTDVWSDAWACFNDELQPREADRRPTRRPEQQSAGMISPNGIFKGPLPERNVTNCQCRICQLIRLGRALDRFALDARRANGAPPASTSNHKPSTSHRPKAAHDTIKIEGAHTLSFCREVQDSELNSPTRRERA